MQRSKGFAMVPVILIVVLLIVAVIGVVIINPFNENGSGGPPGFIKKLTEDRGHGKDQFSKLPECEGRQYTVPIVNIDEINSITPLGNLNPPEHTIPTNHMYLHLNSNGVTLRAPADITITSISSSENKERGTTDYSIDFALCREIHGYFLHIKTLEPELQKLLSEENCNVYGDGGKYKNCWAEVQKELKAGDVIGTVGDSQQGNFDFGAIDFRTKLAYINPDRYAPPEDPNPRSLSIVCPLDIYGDPIKQAFYDKVDRTAEPVCGVVAQDVEGTLQGNWFTGDDQDWNNHLSFVYSNFDPSVAVISIGGVFTQASTYSFTPRSEGVTNRSFDEVKPDGNLYCFESDPNTTSESKETSGKILVKLVSDTELSIESQSGSCLPSEALAKEGFTNPITYRR